MLGEHLRTLAQPADLTPDPGGLLQSGVSSEPVALEIHDLDEGNVLAFDLSEVIDALSPASARLDWLVTDFHPVVLPDERPGDAEVWQFAAKVREAQTDPTKGGVRLSAPQLRELAQKTLQTIDGEFIGVDPSRAAEAPPAARSTAPVVVKAVDSSFWVVITRSDEDAARLRQRFRDVRDGNAALELGIE